MIGMPSNIMNISGIYCLTNFFNGNIYIGQSKDMKQRMKSHYYDLANNRHSNPHLQYSFNRYGEKAFSFSILEYVTNMAFLDDREQYWIDTLHPDYNILYDVTRPGLDLSEARRNPIHIYFHDTFDELIDYLREGEVYKRPEWHAWVYGAG